MLPDSGQGEKVVLRGDRQKPDHFPYCGQDMDPVPQLPDDGLVVRRNFRLNRVPGAGRNILDVEFPGNLRIDSEGPDQEVELPGLFV